MSLIAHIVVIHSSYRNIMYTLGRRQTRIHESVTDGGEPAEIGELCEQEKRTMTD